jgi:NADPH:quinone reductase-like Zn-dependent oxidoreductase
MKVIQLDRYGSPDVLVYTELPTPAPGPGQILIKVDSAGVNYADVMRRSNTPYPFPTPLPFIPGSEVAGSVAALGDGVAGPPVGAAVFALVGHDGSGGYAQYALANAAQVIPIPPGLGADAACALVVAGVTALLLLKEVARVQPGERVLVPGAGGGVGGYAVQLARLLGAGAVIGAASSPAKQALARELGADAAVDYTQPDWPERVLALTAGQGVDVLLEMSGGQLLAEGLRCLAPFGRAVVYGMASREPLRLDDATLMRFFYSPSPNQSLHVFNLGLWFGMRPQVAGAALGELLGYAASGQLRVPIGRALPLAQAAEAHRLLERRQTTGRLILKPWAEA